MSIPPLHVDNPLASANLPSTPLSMRLPATGRPKGEMNWSSLLMIMAVFGLAQAGLIVALNSKYFGTLEWVKALGEHESLLLVVFLVAILVRPLVRGSSYSWLLLAIGALACGVTVSRSSDSTESMRFAIVIVECLACWLIEVGFHYFAVSAECIAITPKGREQHAAWFSILLGYGFTLILLQMLLMPLLGMQQALWAISLVAAILGYQRLSQRSAKPLATLKRQLNGFLFYPGPFALVPGQIASPAGNFVTRAGLVGMFIGSSFVFAFAEFSQNHGLAAIGWATLPVALILSVSTLVISCVGASVEIQDRAEAWHAIVRKMRSSDNPLERNAVSLGYVAADQSPVVVDRSLFFQHFHILGATGANKSSMGLAPHIEQLISFGDASVIIIDLKADSPELYYAADAAVQAYRPGTPLQLFSMENLTRTQVYNPFLTTGWTNLSLQERSDILCTCCGLAHGFEYGEAFFTSCNAAVMTATNLANPDAMSFRQLNRELKRIMQSKSDELLPELRKAGVHALEVIGRLATYEALNVIPNGDYNDAVLENQIQLADYFREPRVGYFRLPSTTSSIGAPSIARLILFFLIIAGKATQRNTKVHVVIDEFQRIASENLEQLLQLARSHDIGLVLCNQSMSDLRANSSKVYHAVSGNCALRQWYSVNSVPDIEILEKLMGTHEEVQKTTTHGTQNSSTSYHTEHVPRARVTDLHTISEDPNLSVLQISGSGRGYARYNGIPFVCYSDYHISATEFERRKNKAWPADLPGMIESKGVHDLEPMNPPPKKNRPDPEKKRRFDNDDLFGQGLFE